MSPWQGPFRVEEKHRDREYGLCHIDTGVKHKRIMSDRLAKTAEPDPPEDYEVRYRRMLKVTRPVDRVRVEEELKVGDFLVVRTEQGNGVGCVLQSHADGSANLQWLNSTDLQSNPRRTWSFSWESPGANKFGERGTSWTGSQERDGLLGSSVAGEHGQEVPVAGHGEGRDGGAALTQGGPRLLRRRLKPRRESRGANCSLANDGTRSWLQMAPMDPTNRPRGTTMYILPWID